jgi:hypothetical protein
MNSAHKLIENAIFFYFFFFQKRVYAKNFSLVLK